MKQGADDLSSDCFCLNSKDWEIFLVFRLWLEAILALEIATAFPAPDLDLPLFSWLSLS